MRKLIVILGIGIITFIFWILLGNSNVTPSRQVSPQPTKDLSRDNTQTKEPVTSKALFIPYWTVGKEKIESSGYDKLIYFGITPTEDGITTDTGYKNIDTFNSIADEKTEKQLAVRMINSDLNSTILRNPSSQKKIITDSLRIAKQKNFSGIVFDFEISSLAFSSTTTEITIFTTAFAKAAHADHLSFTLMIYGDTFYRLRPYDIGKLASVSDSIMIMAYDFHKSRGNPGPNFPLRGKETYGYDFVTMIDDYLKFVPKEKITVIFGLFGYDWVIDEKKQSIQNGEPLSTSAIQKKFTKCPYKNCNIRRDADSAETEITYTGSDGKNHSVWYEDLQSVEKKQAYGETRGITHIGFWANTYY